MQLLPLDDLMKMNQRQVYARIDFLSHLCLSWPEELAFHTFAINSQAVFCCIVDREHCLRQRAFPPCAHCACGTLERRTIWNLRTSPQGPQPLYRTETEASQGVRCLRLHEWLATTYIASMKQRDPDDQYTPEETA